MSKHLRLPVKGNYRITMGFGSTDAPYSKAQKHNGTDFVSDDRKIYATHDGKITFAGWANDVSGNMVALDDGKDRVTFSHIKPGGFKVKVGDQVKAGQYIADMGTTGYSTGTHLHAVLNSGKEDLMKRAKGDNMNPTEQDVRDYFKVWEPDRQPPTKAELADYTSRPWRYLTDKMLQDLKGEYEDKIKQLKKSPDPDGEKWRAIEPTLKELLK